MQGRGAIFVLAINVGSGAEQALECLYLSAVLNFGAADRATARLQIELIRLRKFLRFRCKSTRRKGELDSTNRDQRCIGPE